MSKVGAERGRKGSPAKSSSRSAGVGRRSVAGVGTLSADAVEMGLGDSRSGPADSFRLSNEKSGDVCGGIISSDIDCFSSRHVMISVAGIHSVPELVSKIMPSGRSSRRTPHVSGDPVALAKRRQRVLPGFAIRVKAANADVVFLTASCWSSDINGVLIRHYCGPTREALIKSPQGDRTPSPGDCTFRMGKWTSNGGWTLESGGSASP